MTQEGGAAQAERRNELLTAAMEVFAAKGYYAAKVADIVAAAGVAQGTFYLYFASKQDAFKSILDERLAPLLHLLGTDSDAPPAAPAGLPTAAQLRAALLEGYRGILRFYRANPALLRLLIAPTGDPQLDALVAGLRQGLAGRLAAEMRQLMAGGVIRTFPAEPLAYALSGMVFRVAVQYVTGPGEPNDALIETLAEMLTDFELYGLLGPPTPPAHDNAPGPAEAHPGPTL